MVVDNYVAHFHETAEYKGLEIHFRRVAYKEVFDRLSELHQQLDLTAVRGEFLDAKPSTPAIEAEDLVEEVNLLGGEGQQGENAS